MNKGILLVLALLSAPAFSQVTTTLEDMVKEQEDSIQKEEKLSDSYLVDPDSVYLEHETGDEIEFENNLEASQFEDQAKQDAKNNGCSQSRNEKIVCANIMCDFGLLLGEWPSECLDYKLKLAEAIAKTPPWKSLPSCFFVDSSCKKSGKASDTKADEDYCNKLSDLAERHQCLMALELGTKGGAVQFTEENGGDVSKLDDVDFTEDDRTTISDEYLIANVDPRFEFDTHLEDTYWERYKKCKYGKYRCKWKWRDTGISPSVELSFYLEHRDDPSYYNAVKEKEAFLISKGTLQRQCIGVPNEQFYNCNFYPELPPQCWEAPSHQAIAECVNDLEN